MTIRKSIWVSRSQEFAFKVFCEEMSQWWPGGYGGKDSRPYLEARVGGRFGERRPDGAEIQIGRVTAYEPPSRVAFSWRAPTWTVDTQVEVRFTAARGGTQIDLEHNGWDQEAKTREGRGNYDSGWDHVLGCYQAACESASAPR